MCRSLAVAELLPTKTSEPESKAKRAHAAFRFWCVPPFPSPSLNHYILHGCRRPRSGSRCAIKPICTIIHDTLSSYRSFGKDAQKLRLRFVVQQTCLKHVLFEDQKFLPAMPGRLIDRLPQKICDDILGLLQQFYGLLLEYAAMRA